MASSQETAAGLANLKSLVRAALLVFLAYAGILGVAMARDQLPNAPCAADFAEVMDGPRYPALSDKIKGWEALASHCKDTGIYEARLGGLYTNAGRYEEARAVLKCGLALKSDYQQQLRLGLSDVDFRQGKIDESATESLALIKDFPDWAGGYAGLGETRLVQHRFPEAIENLERANAMEPSSGAYILLTMAYYGAGRPRESAMAMQKALRLNRSALENTEAVCAAAYSLVLLGYLHEADDILTKHLKVRPGAASDREYQEAVAAIKKRLAAPSAAQ